MFLRFIYLISRALYMTDIDSLMGNVLGQLREAAIGQVLRVTRGIVLLDVNFVCQMAYGLHS